MRCGVEFHGCLHRRRAGQRERNQLHRQLVDSGQRPGHQQRRKRLGTAVDIRRLLHRRLGVRIRRGRAVGVGSVGVGTGSVSGLLFSPYKDVTINMNWNTDADAVGRGRQRPAGGGLQQPGVGVHPQAARDHPRVRYRNLRQRDLGWCLGCQLGCREHSATPERQPRLRCLDRWRGRDFQLRLDGWHGRVHRSLRQPEPGRHGLRHRRRPDRVADPGSGRRGGRSSVAVPEPAVLVHARHAGSIRWQLRRGELARQRGRRGGSSAPA